MTDPVEGSPRNGGGHGIVGGAVDVLLEGEAVFDADWTIVSVNEPGARLLGRRRERLVGRNIWIALPELGGTILHTFLLHARSVGEPVTWHGYYAPTDRWLNASAERIDQRLRVTFRDVSPLIGRTASGVLRTVTSHEGGDHDRLRFLAEVSESMISTLDTGESLQKLLDLLVPRMCDWAVVALIGENRETVGRARAHRDPAMLPVVDAYLDRAEQGSAEESPMAAAFFTGEPIVVHPIPRQLLEDPAMGEQGRAAWEQLDTDALTIVPLRARGEVFGGIAMMNTTARGPHSEMEIATAVEVARRAGLALDNARLYERQLKVAETLQRSLLTPPPEPDHLQIVVRYQPASRNMHVGGDWYDAFQQPDGATLLVIGDVVGHNVDAAAEMGQVRSILRGIAYDRQESPARILGRVDEVLSGLRIATLATALVARVEQPPENEGTGFRTLRWSSAGHLPPLVRHADGSVTRLDSPPETLLGTGGGRTRSDSEVRLEPGDTLVFYTDGLVEQGRTLIDEGIDRLADVLRDVGHLPLDELCDGLLGRIVGGRSDDDVAIVAVRMNPE